MDLYELSLKDSDILEEEINDHPEILSKKDSVRNEVNNSLFYFNLIFICRAKDFFFIGYVWVARNRQ